MRNGKTMNGCLIIKIETRNKLKLIGNKAETYDDIINRLINLGKSGMESS
jgi:hypothetical protein